MLICSSLGVGKSTLLSSLYNYKEMCIDLPRMETNTPVDIIIQHPNIKCGGFVYRYPACMVPCDGCGNLISQYVVELACYKAGVDSNDKIIEYGTWSKSDTIWNANNFNMVHKHDLINHDSDLHNFVFVIVHPKYCYIKAYKRNYCVDIAPQKIEQFKNKYNIDTLSFEQFEEFKRMLTVNTDMDDEICNLLGMCTCTIRIFGLFSCFGWL